MSYLRNLIWPLIIAFCFYGPVSAQDVSPEDENVWKTAEHFVSCFDRADTSEMNRILPGDFMMQWLHEGFLGKTSLIKMMTDTAMQSSFRHQLVRDANTLLLYSDNLQAACLNATIGFLDSGMISSLKNSHQYGVCIFYFQKSRAGWIIKTVHIDIHCWVCDSHPPGSSK